jgi:hypothetical protein
MSLAVLEKPAASLLPNNMQDNSDRLDRLLVNVFIISVVYLSALNGRSEMNLVGYKSQQFHKFYIFNTLIVIKIWGERFILKFLNIYSLRGRERTIPTERPPLVVEFRANLCG